MDGRSRRDKDAYAFVVSSSTRQQQRSPARVSLPVARVELLVFLLLLVIPFHFDRTWID